jgi:hypothetical protein
MNDKYLIIEQIKLNTFNDIWSVKYFDQSYDDAFTKLVALETLKGKDDDNKVYYVVGQNHLWTKSSDVKIDSKIKTAQETEQQELF